LEGRVIRLSSAQNVGNKLYYYRVFGIGIESDFALDSLVPCSAETLPINPVIVRLGSVSAELTDEPTVDAGWYKFNSKEFYYEIPDIIRFIAATGRSITVEPLCDDWQKMLLFFYSNAVAAVLLQRGIIPFHVSGVLDKSGKVWLFAGHSKSGKSTTALMLKERGYELFTDDTALLEVINGKAMTVASYPMIRVWEKTLEIQQAFAQEKAFQMRKGIEKYGIHFHETFRQEPIEIAGIVFLNNTTESLKVESISRLKAFFMLRQNVYRNNWTSKMGLEHKIFNTISGILTKVPTFQAFRPSDRQSFDEFAQLIEEQIIENSSN
jgi:hypothetical protein